MTEQTIFLAALDISDPGKRAAYVAQACGGDEALRQQVDSLLAAHDRSGEFLDRPAAEQMGRNPAADTVTADAGAATPADDSLSFLAPPARPDSLGRLGRYDVLEVLGRGGFGTVLRAFDDRLHRVVAIKVLAPQLAASGSARARFVREARAGAAVRDEHVVHVYEVAEPDEPVPYLVMEYVAGQTLQQKLDRGGPLSIPEVLRIGSQIAKGLAAAHATGLIHRDVKPSNILLENGVERVKITDFGLARAADDASLSHSGTVAGTPMYMSPEQARGEKVDPRSDLFSLGSVLYAMLSGRPPFRAGGTLAVLKRVAEDDPRPIRDINPEVPEWLAAVVAKLLAKDPAGRFASAREVADLLVKCLGELQSTGAVTAVIAPVAPAVPARPARKRRRIRAAILLGVLFAVGPGLLYLYNKGFGNVSRYLADRADVRVPVWDRNVERILVNRDGLPVATIESGSDTTHLPPGRYQLEVVTRPDYRLARVTYDTTGVGPTMTAGTEHHGGRFELILHRGDEFRVFVTTEFDLDGVEARNRAAIKNNLAEISRAVNEFGAGVPISLFNGNDLSGWRVVGDPANSWQVRDGHLWGSGGETYLVSARKFQNFHLKADVRVSPGGSAGILFRADPSDAALRQRSFHPGGVEMKSSPLDAGGLRTFDLGLSADWKTQATHSAGGPFRADQWVRVDLVARDDRVSATVGGHTLEMTDRRPQAGPIILRLGSRDTVFEVRTIEVMELPGDAPPASTPKN